MKQKIEQRREVYKKILDGQDNLFDTKLRREVKNLVLEKKFEVWNEVEERVIRKNFGMR